MSREFCITDNESKPKLIFGNWPDLIVCTLLIYVPYILSVTVVCFSYRHQTYFSVQTAFHHPWYELN